MSHYQHLSIEERESIWEKQIKGESVRRIAAELGRSASTIGKYIRMAGMTKAHRHAVGQTISK